jgi:uncharacterized protein (TIGR03118 family)
MQYKNLPFRVLNRLIVSPGARVAALRQLAVFTVVAAMCPPMIAQSYKVTNLVSDGSVPAVTTDPNFLNPWAMSASPTWWISTANTGYNYVIPPAATIAFKVIVPLGSNPSLAGLPAGSVTTAGASGMLLSNGVKASFVFSTLDGTISGWNSRLGTANALSLVAINNSSAGASYPGLAIVNNASGSFILAPNFGVGNKIEIYDNTFKSATLAGTFTDPTLPAGYSPFAVHVIGSQVFVTYALRTSAAPYRTVNGVGNGVVSIFDVNGNFVARAVTGGNLNAPWGVAIAPANFGLYSNALLIGNFGDGLINVYDAKTFTYLGQLMDTTGKSLAYASLWELLPGGTAVAGTTAVSGGDVNTVYFTAGLAGEAHGLLGAISTNTATGTPGFNFTASSGSATVAAGDAATFNLALAPVNGFNGTVALNCSNLPVSATCSFASASPAVSSTAVATTTVKIQTFKKTSTAMQRGRTSGIASAILLPLASLLLLRRQRLPGSVRLLSGMLVFAAMGGLIAGCAGQGPDATPSTPAGQSTVTINATSGTAVQQTTVSLTVQ